MEQEDLDYYISQDASLDVDLSDFLDSGADSVPLELSSGAGPSSHATNDSEAQTQRRYLAKRPHRKSRAGCKQCKKRKVKCDEAKPTCKACTLRKEPCVYPNVPRSAPSTTARSVSTGATSTAPDRETRAQSVTSGDEVEDIDRIDIAALMAPVIAEPVFIPDQAIDMVDMKMLWFYTAHSYNNFSINAGRSSLVDYALKVKVVEHAFRSSFLMDTVKALSAMDLRTLNQPVPAQKLASYQAGAFEGYRNAIETANPDDFPALLACSLFILAMTSQSLRDRNGKRLFIVDWIAMWRGIGLIIDLISPQVVQDSGLSALFYRPPIDTEKAVQFIPNNLLFMVTSIRDGDDDYQYQKDYYELLRCLGSLYQELTDHGFGPVLDLRIITFFSFFPRVLLPLSRQHRPRILVIIAYWVCFTQILHKPSWWMRGFELQAEQIFEEVGEKWEHLLRVPKMVLQTEDRVERARLIIDNHNWTPNELDLYHKHRDPRAKNELKLITNEGAEVEIADGQWRFKTTKVRWDIPQVLQPTADPVLSSQNMLIGSTLLYNAMPRNTVSAELASLMSKHPNDLSRRSLTQVTVTSSFFEFKWDVLRPLYTNTTILSLSITASVTYKLQPKPNLTGRQIRRHTMSHALRVNPLHLSTVITRSVSLLRVILHRARRRLAKIKNGSPLLDLLLVILRRQRRVGAAVPDLHLRPRPAVPRVHIQNNLLPLIRRRLRLPAAARIVPLVDAPGRADETTRRDARV